MISKRLARHIRLGITNARAGRRNGHREHRGLVYVSTAETIAYIRTCARRHDAWLDRWVATRPAPGISAAEADRVLRAAAAAGAAYVNGMP